MGKRARSIRATPGRRELRVDRLVQMTTHVGQLFGTKPDCIRAVALLVTSAELVGYNLTPHAVALAAQNGDQGAAMLGAEAARDFPDAEVGDRFDDSGWGGAGHLVATLERPRFLLDPTLQQISGHLGVTPFVLATSLGQEQPAAGPWDFADGGLKLRYHLVPHDNTWREGYDAERERCRPTAHDLAAVVRSGREGVLVWD